MDLYFHSYKWQYIWKKEYLQDLANFNEKLQKLLNNLDEESLKYTEKLLKINLKTSHVELIFNMIKSYIKAKFFKKNLLKSKYSLGNNSTPDAYLQTYKNGFSYIENEYLKYVSGKDFIDGGAYIGDSAVILNELNPKSIHCFEPNSKNYNILKKTIKINQLEDKIIANDLGLEKESKTIYLKDSSVRCRVSVTETENKVNVISIDDYVSQNNLNIGLIKLDVESLEYNVILGAEKTIRAQEPVLLISVYHTLKDFLEIKPLIESYSKNYEFIIRPTHSYSLNLEFMLIAYPRL